MQENEKNVKKITLVFENVDFLEIPIECVNMLDFRSSYVHCHYQKEYQSASGKIIKTNYISDLIIVLNSNAVGLITNFGKEEFNKELTDYGLSHYGMSNCNSLYDRINKGRDICQLEIEFNDGKKEVYHINWKGDDEYQNEGQKTYKIEDDLIVIQVE